MSKIAFIFPGQGAQTFGMGKDFYERHEGSQRIFEEASEITEINIAGLCFEENDFLNITEYTQVAVLTTSIAILEASKDYNITPSVCAGLSLGEYSALVASGALEFNQACHIVRQRGIFMQDAVPVGLGAMAAVLSLEVNKIEEVCSKIEGVEIANYNCPGQIVISGEKEAVKEAGQLLLDLGAKRVVMLNVSGPFHSSMLKDAGKKLATLLESISFHKPHIPYVTNVTGEYVKEMGQIKEFLEKQVYSPVRWQQGIEAMIAEGVDTFIEIGPGKSLSAFVKKIDSTKRILNIEKFEDMEKVALEVGKC
ncbi:MAG: ACP S-malonyltransferase [Clostridiales bacterium]|nr:ACP S-malonyltransferase [Clostridiales bacterium]